MTTKEWTVTWAIDIDADTPTEAAMKSLLSILGPLPIESAYAIIESGGPLVFSVCPFGQDGPVTQIDLEETP